MDFCRPFSVVTPTLDGPVLRVLSRTHRPLTTPQVIALSDDGSPAGIRKVLQRLTSQGIVVESRVGHTRTFSANRNHLLWPAVELIARAHDELDSRITRVVEQWTIPALSVELFGSVASGRSTSDSDVDLLVVAPEMTPTQVDSWARQIHELQDQVEQWTGNVCEVLELTRADLRGLRPPSNARVLEGPRQSLFGSPIEDLL